MAWPAQAEGVALNYRAVIVGVGLGFAIAEVLADRVRGRTGSQLAFDVVSGGAVGFVVGPLVTVAASLLLDAVTPGSRDALAHLPVWAMVAMLLLGDDLTQYWWHRACHSVPWLYTLHRAHHSAPYMSVSIVYRNNLLYYALMPGLWIAGALVHLGFGSVYAVYIIVKLTVIIGAHSSLRWDAPLYRIRALRPVMWVVERVISTPSTHSMHHGLHAGDGVTHYKGNYGNLLFFWDVLFGTARITRRYPEAFGIEGLRPQSHATELAWPFIPLQPEEEAAGELGQPRSVG